MKIRTRKALGWGWLVACLFCAVCLCFLGGCAFTPYTDGRPGGVLGLPVGTGAIDGSVASFVSAASGFLPPPWNFLASGALALLGVGVPAVVAKSSAKKEAAANQVRVDAAFDEGHARASGPLGPAPAQPGQLVGPVAADPGRVAPVVPTIPAAT